MSREQVLHSIRRSISEAGMRGRMKLPAHPPGPRYGADPTGQFIRRLEAHACTWERIGSLDEVPARCVAWLESRSLARRIAHAPPLAGLAWPDDMRRHSARAGIDEAVAVSLAFAGVAETGSLVMYSGPDSPITHNYAPEFHLIVLRESDLCHNQEEVWAKVRATGAMPRALNLIAGPSRTGDVEQTIQLGAHGPRQVHVLLIGTAALTT